MYEQSLRWREINAAAANKIVADGISIRDRILVVGVFGYRTPATPTPSMVGGRGISAVLSSCCLFLPPPANYAGHLTIHALEDVL